MTFGNALANAVSGMNAATNLVQVRSHNIANALTPGYARRDVALQAGVTGGVRVTEVIRAQDSFLLGDRLTADSRSADANVRSEAIARLGTIYGAADGEEGLYPVLARFETALDDLATTPEGATYQRAAIDAGKDVALTFNRIGDRVTEVRSEADREIGAIVRNVNSALRQLEQLNGASDRGTVNGLSNLGEQRQSLIDTIASALDIKVAKLSGDRVKITTGEGVLLLGETARQIEFREGTLATPGTSIASGHLSGISVDGISLTPKSGAQAVRTGSLAAQFAVRDEIAVTFGDRIDTLATDLIDRFADAGVDPTLGGGQGLFVSAVTGVGSASRIEINAAVDPERGGELWRIRDGVGATAPGPDADIGVIDGLRDALIGRRALPSVTDTPSSLGYLETAASLSSVIGTASLEASAAATAATTTAQALRNEELSANGVNTDQELQSLLLVEQAYAANARVVQTVNDMLARLLEI